MKENLANKLSPFNAFISYEAFNISLSTFYSKASHSTGQWYLGMQTCVVQCHTHRRG